MSRAELRRQQKNDKKAKTKTFVFTQEQMDAAIMKALTPKLESIQKKAEENALETAMALTLTIPLKVLMDHYWTELNDERLGDFADYLIEYYEKWMNDELDMDQMKKDLWKYGGVKIVDGDEEDSE